MKRVRGARPATRSPRDPVPRVERCPTSWRRCPVYLVPPPRMSGGTAQFVWRSVPNWLAFSTDADHSPRTSVGVASEADFLAEQEDRNHAMADLARIEAARSKQQMERERPLKSQIGASICKPDRRVLLQGFTEGVSPDNGKIQIRVWRASYPNNGRPSSLTQATFNLP